MAFAKEIRAAKADGRLVRVLRGAFEAALEAYGKGPAPDGEALWRAIQATASLPTKQCG